MKKESKLNSLKLLLIQASAILLALLAFEGLLRFEIIQPKFLLEHLSFRIDKRLLFELTPNASDEIDQHGRRVSSLSNAGQKKKIYYFGDSFVFGTGVDADNTTSHHLQKIFAKDYEVINLGVPGYGPDQSLLKLQDLLSDIKEDDIIVLGLYAGNDIMDVANHKLFDLDAQDSLVATPGAYAKWSKTSFLTPFVLDMYLSPFSQGKTLFTKFYRNLFANSFDEAFAKKPSSSAALHKKKLVQKILSKFKTEATKQTPNLVFVVVPSYESYHLRESLLSKGIYPSVMSETFKDICKNSQLPCLHMDEYWDAEEIEPGALFSHKDWHFGSKGYQIVANAVAESIKASINQSAQITLERANEQSRR